MEYILAIDQGTHASRALLLDEQGRMQASHLLGVDLKRPQPGRAEQDGEQIQDSVTGAIERVMHTLPAPARRQVTACGVTTQRSSVLAWQNDGVVRSSLLSWQDTRGAVQLDHLAPRRHAIRQLSGLPLSPHYGASKLHWLHQLLGQPPGLRCGPLASFLLDRLTGQTDSNIDHSNAQRMQLFDIHRLAWSRQLGEWFDVPLDILPGCQPVAADYGRLKAYDVPVTAVCGDQNAAWFAHGQPTEGSALVNIGSGAFVLAARTGDATPEGLLTSIAYSDAAHCDYLVEGTVNGAGSALEWLRKQRGLTAREEQLEHWLERVNNPPLFINSVGGLGSPWWCHTVEPRFVPPMAQHGDAELAVAVIESVLFLLQYNLEEIQAQQAVRSLRISGGLSRLSSLCKKLADLSGLPVIRCDQPEASARGIGWLAAGRPALWSGGEPTGVFEPGTDNALSARYERFIGILQAIVSAEQT